MASGFINGNSLPATALGTFDYIKNFLVIFIYAAFFRDFNDFKKIFRLLLIVALFLGTIALVQFIWAMGSVYIFKKDVMDPSVYIFVNRSSFSPSTIFWRYGIFRSPFHAYNLGLNGLLILTILCNLKRVNIIVFIPLISGVIASASRMAYAGLMFVMSIQIFKKRKKWIIPLFLMITLVAVLFINNPDDINSKILNLSKPTDESNLATYNVRAYTRYKSIEIWKDHPYWGVGPGMFGGIVASKFHSYIYEEYNVLNQAYILRIGGIEQFWFQIMAETGVAGTFCFVSFFFILFLMLYNSMEKADSEEMKGLFSALMVFIVCILIYSLGSGINIAPVLFTYCAFAGIGLGCLVNQRDKNR